MCGITHTSHTSNGIGKSLGRRLNHWPTRSSSTALLADGEGMKKQCLSHVRELVKNPAKILTDPCVFSHDCKSKDGDGGDAAPPPPPKKKSGGDGVPAGLGNAALRQLRAAKSG